MNTPRKKRVVTKKFTPTREWLVECYVEGDMTGGQVREITGYSKSGFAHLLQLYGIKAKGVSLPKLDISFEQLYQMHVVEGLTAVKIAAKLKCHNSAISRLIKHYDLDPGRELVNIPMVPPLTHDELWKLYWVDRLSAGDIARNYGLGRSTVLRWFKYYDIPTRVWNGGEVNRTYIRKAASYNRNGNEFNAQEREKIFRRDDHHCRMPGCGNIQRLEVHHILPIKYGGTNELGNGITLCYSCHDRIKTRELQFVTLFQNILSP